MRRPPPLIHASLYPVTTVTAALAVALTLLWWAKPEFFSFLPMDYRALGSQPWRLVTSALLHADAIHLIFNLYWMWAFGTCVEEYFRGWRALGIFLLLAAGPSAAQYAFSGGGVGLSGVIYGLFGMLWVLHRRDPRFARALDYQTTVFLVFWFFFCIVMTLAHLWHIGNVAHGCGALMGWLLGWAISARTSRHRLLYSVALAALAAAILLGATVARPLLNFSADRGSDLFDAGIRELHEDRPERAEPLLRRAVDLNPRQAGWWLTLGIAYQRLGRESEAQAAFEQTYRLRPLEPTLRNQIAVYRVKAAEESEAKNDHQEAVRLYREAVELNDREPTYWYHLGVALEAAGRPEDAADAFRKAAALDPRFAPPRQAPDKP